MYIDTVPNRNSPPAILLREGWREGGTVKKRTLANLSKWPPEVVEGLRVLLKGGTAVKRLPEAFDVERSKPHGHVAAVLGAIKRLGLPRLIDAQPSPQRDRTVALIAARILHPGSKLAAARGLAEETSSAAFPHHHRSANPPSTPKQCAKRHRLATLRRRPGRTAL